VSQTDSFIEEVTEEVRRDVLYGYARKYGWIAVLVVVLAVGGAAYNEWSKARTTAAAQAQGDAIIAALNADDATARATALEKLAGDAGPAATLIELRRAAILAEEGDKDAAAALLEKVASAADTTAIYRDLAQLKLVILQGDAMEASARMAILDRLANPGAPYRAVALEQRALALLAAGDQDAALTQLTDLLDEPGISQGMSNRTQQLIVALGGTLPDTASLLSAQ
jgi:hypothetical protein